MKRLSTKTIKGKISLHPRGFGFVSSDMFQHEVFIPRPLTMGAMDGDLVEVEFASKPSKKGYEGKVIKIVTRARTTIGATVLYQRNGDYCLFSPHIGQDREILIKTQTALKRGDRVRVKIKSWGKTLRGTLDQVIGSIKDPSIDATFAADEFGIETEFSKAAVLEAKKLGSEVATKDLKGRKDLTALRIVTIDPESARDYDDAISIDKKEHYTLGVHIADASHYILEGSSLDREAYERGNSVYFPEKCIPMLPPSLSDGLLSLKPDVIRLTVTVMMTIDQTGDLLNYEIFRSFIKSQKRFTYEEALDVLKGKANSPFSQELRWMEELGTLLKKKRSQRGSIDFSLPETKIRVDKKGTPLAIDTVEYDITHQMIEEFMLKANEIVALDSDKKGNDLIYRIHEEPNAENFRDFLQLAEMLGFEIADSPKEEDFQKLFSEAKDSPHLSRLSVAFIRSMKLACYSKERLGHYGLKLTHYAHFTSPIRRYSDLIVHRILLQNFKNQKLEAISKHLSERERAAMKAESAVILLKKLRLLKRALDQNPNKTFEATISKIKPFLVLFELKEFYLEGALTLSELRDDYYLFDPKKAALKGERSGRTFSFGDAIGVKVKEIDLIRQEVVYELIDS